MGTPARASRSNVPACHLRFSVYDPRYADELNGARCRQRRREDQVTRMKRLWFGSGYLARGDRFPAARRELCP